MDAITLILLAGATARLTRLAVVDDIAGPFRDLVRLGFRTVAGHRGAIFAHGLITCPFCIGFWIAVAVTASWVAAGDTLAWHAAAGALTLSYIAGHAVARLDVGDGDE